MKTYWDLSEKERAELTAEQLTALEALELMEVGVLRCDPLVLLDEPVMPKPDRRGFVLKGEDVVFDTIEVARASIEGGAGRLQHKYLADDYRQPVRWLKPISGHDERTVEEVAYYSEASFLEAQTSMAIAAAARKENDRRREQHQKDWTAQSDALTRLRDDHRTCCLTGERMKRVLSTLAEYEQMAGSRDVAMSFLDKAFTAGDIEKAMQWGAPAVAAE